LGVFKQRYKRIVIVGKGRLVMLRGMINLCCVMNEDQRWLDLAVQGQTPTMLNEVEDGE
jgi:hypothetical protein